ncbi:MAG: ABC transporter permease [Clostridiales Family XIII bacterium]|jgi:NitT/TauT family transport system permease protein|nr:ABC transporter permease [Clostridiales Family XIII bacterium]
MEEKKQIRAVVWLQTMYRKSILIIVILLAWAIIPLFVRNMFLPSLLDVLEEMWEMILSGELIKHLMGSLKRAAAGLLIAELLAIPIGIGLGWFPRFESYLDPLLQAMRNTSVLTILPLFVLLLGIGEVSKVTIITWGCFFPTLINTIQGVKNVDPILIRAARSMGISGFGLFRKVVLPGSMSYIIAGFRLSASVSLLVLVGSEMLGADFGLGYMILHYQQAFLIKKMYCGILVMIIIGVLLNSAIIRLERKLTVWQDKPDLQKNF